MSSAINGWAEDPCGTLGEGTTQLRAALDLDTSDPLTQYYIGATYCYTGQWGKSVRFLQKSLKTNPHQPNAMLHMGLSRGFLGEYEQAYECFDNAERMAAGEAASGPYIW